LLPRQNERYVERITPLLSWHEASLYRSSSCAPQNVPMHSRHWATFKRWTHFGQSGVRTVWAKQTTIQASEFCLSAFMLTGIFWNFTD
jgi:hypothetical protein